MSLSTTYQRCLRIPVFVLILMLLCGSILQAQSNLYVTVYYPTWMFRSGSSPTWYAVPPWDMKFTGVTHIIQFGNVNVTTTYPYFTPMTSDSLEWAFGTESNGESNRTFYRDSLVTIAHRQGAKVLICIQQAQDGSALYSITSDSAKTDSFAVAVAGYVQRHNYDGVDVNWETSIGNKTQTSRLFRRLRARLGSSAVITISPLSGGWDNYDAATCNAYVNQINPQEYDISDAWNGCISVNGNWPINALHQGATTNCSGTNQQGYDSRGPVQWEEQGFRPSILGIGIASFGRMYVGSKVIGGAHPVSRQDVCSYYTGDQLLASGGVLVQDPVRNAEYIVGTATSDFNYRSCSVPAGQDYFFTYQTPAVIPGQVSWVRQNGFGGIMVYDFQGDCDKAGGYGQTNPIINAIVSAVGNGPPVPDSTNPVIELTLPLDGSTVSGPVPLSATASDNIGIARVEFRIDGSVALTDYAAPYGFTWNAAKIRGSHTVSARAYDAAGNFANSATATVSVIAPPSDSIPHPAVLRDDFNTPNPPLPDRLKWTPLLNARLNGSMQIVGNQLRPTADPGTYPNGGMAWDSLMGPGTEESITVTQKSGDYSETSLYLYAKMDGTDYSTGSGYRLRYWEKSGTDLFAIQIVGPGYGVYYDLGTGSSTANYELQPGDEVTFRVLSDNKTMIGLVNGVELVRAVDSTYMPQQWYFAMLAGVFSQAVQFDDFKVSSGYTPPTPKIQGTVFFDQNNNGVRDSTEPGMSGWTVHIDGPTSASQVTDSSGSYSFERLPLGSYTVTENNREAWTHTLPSGTGAYSLTISDPGLVASRDIGNFSPTVVAAQIQSGWRLLSVPVQLSDRRLQSVFPTAGSPAFAFHRIYVSQDPLSYGDGYWMRFPQGQTLWTAGTDLGSDTAHVTPGWNLVGSISHPIPANQAYSDPPGILTSPFWKYWQAYNVADSIQPGYGYWVKASQDGMVIFSGHHGGAMSQPLKSSPVDLGWMNTLRFTDGTSENRVLYFSQKPAGKELEEAFELPPVPPAGVFDARFHLPRVGSEGSSAVFSVGTGTAPVRVPIILGSVTYPLRISWTMNSSDAHFRLTTNDGTVHDLTTSGELTLSDPGPEQEQDPLRMTLEMSNDGTAPLPSAYELSQNYPNPFNNGTLIHLSLPSDAYVRLSVYNVLGERIAPLVDRQMEAGRHTIPFDATGIPSGVYFYRVDVSGPSNEVFSKVLRMTLLK